MLTLFALWGALAVVLVIFGVGGPREGGALTLSYFLGLSLIHVPGVLPYIFSPGVPFLYNAQGLQDPDATHIGFGVTLIGMGAFVVGACLARLFDPSRGARTEWSPLRRGAVFGTLGRRAIGFGIIAYFVVIPVAGGVPSLTSVVSALGALLILGLWLELYGAAEEGNQARIGLMLSLLPVLPLATLVTGGFIGYGVIWVLSVLAFLFVIVRQRLWFYVAAPVVLLLGLSLFVTYMGQRSGIREVVWNKHAGLAERLDRVLTLVTDFEVLDLGSSAHISALDGRLNQNALVGLAVEHIDSGWAELAYGGTLPVWALIPRAVWPDKPAVGGGTTSLVSEYTGLEFAVGTSVGAGQVFELYVNFATPGVVVGFLLLGFGLVWLDRGIMRALAADDMRGVVLRALPGLTLLQPGGNLLEIIVAAVAAVAVAHLVVHFSAFGIFRAASIGRQAR